VAGKNKPIPEGYHSLTPYLTVDGAARAIAFYQKAFGAREVLRLDGPGGKVGHAEITIGDSRLMLGDEFPELDARGPKAFGGSPVGLYLYVEDADAVVAKAVAAGATLTSPVTDKFYGDRSGSLTDPFGHHWFIATRKESLSAEELSRRSAEHLKKQGAG
jgi:PhnB protein